MALTPENYSELLDEVVEQEETEEIAPSKTWKLDFENGTIGGFIDGPESLRQYIIKALMTERSRYVIYTDDYGNELQDLVGDDMTPELLDAEIPRMVYEALAYDDRIEDVTDIEYSRAGDALYINFTVVLASGATFTQEVTMYGV